MSVSDASRTGMPYLPKEPVTPRGIEFTRVDRLPAVGSTSPYKGDMEGNVKMEFGGTEMLKKRKIKTTELGPLGDGPGKQDKEVRSPAPIVTNKSISMHYHKAAAVADVSGSLPVLPSICRCCFVVLASCGAFVLPCAGATGSAGPLACRPS